MTAWCSAVRILRWTRPSGKDWYNWLVMSVTDKRVGNGGIYATSLPSLTDLCYPRRYKSQWLPLHTPIPQPQLAAACNDCSQGARSTWKYETILSNRINFYHSTTWANEPMSVTGGNNSLSLPVMHSACWHLQHLRSYFHIISLGHGDMKSILWHLSCHHPLNRF